MHFIRTNKTLAALAVLTALACAAPAMAQPANKVAAEALFDEGRRLMSDGKYAEACPKLMDSYKLDAAPGTLLNLGLCYEKNGQTASAWATFRDAIAESRQANRADFQEAATRHAAALEGKLSRLTITAVSPAPGMEITRDGVAIASAEMGTAIPVDPGTRTIKVTAPAKKPWSVVVEVKPDGDQVKLEIPPLEDAPEEPKPAATAAPLPAPSRATATSHAIDVTPTNAGSPSRALALVAGGVGVVGLGVGTVFLLGARSKYDDSLAFCRPENPSACTPQGADMRDDARSKGNVATIGFGIGIAALVTGAVLWLTAPSAPAARSMGGASTLRVSVAPAPNGMSVQGVW